MPGFDHGAAREADEFARRQPSYFTAIMDPTSLRGYTHKQLAGLKWTPLWLDYAMFGPPLIRDSSPGWMAAIFGRTDHDTKWNPKKKGTLKRAWNSLCLIAIYIFLMYVPAHEMWFRGIKPYFWPIATEIADITCGHGFMRKCDAGCKRAGPFACVPA